MYKKLFSVTLTHVFLGFAIIGILQILAFSPIKIWVLILISFLSAIYLSEKLKRKEGTDQIILPSRFKIPSKDSLKFLGGTLFFSLCYVSAMTFLKVPFSYNSGTFSNKYIFLALFSCPVIEELIFRGMFLSQILILLKSRHTAILFTTLIFTIFHYLPNQSLKESIFHFLPVIFISLINGYRYLNKKNLLLPMMSHFTHNLIMILVSY